MLELIDYITSYVLPNEILIVPTLNKVNCERKMSLHLVNLDLERERKKCTFNTLELTNFWDGGAQITEKRRKIEHYFYSDPKLKDEVPLDFLSHKEKYEKAVQKACYVYKKAAQLRKGQGEDAYRERCISAVIYTVLKHGNPFGLTNVMFMPAVEGQGTTEQLAYWKKRHEKFDFIGTYAQTELGHGTFIRGLETTAHYDPKRKEFILNSPTLTSYKWWPGNLGHTANYAIVVAQLYTKGEHRGIHLFIVQLRDEQTHKPLPGIEVGEIGTKLGMHTINNGYLGLKNVRIPRFNMLMKYAQVLEDGTYVKSANDKLAYGTMMYVRTVMLYDMANQMAKAATIATRYSAVRRQSEMKPGEQEPQILDYQTQQYKLLPHVATAFALKFTADWVWNLYQDLLNDLKEGELNRLQEFHALGSCLKTVSTADTTCGVETCRLSCGGHGYMTCSNFNCIYGVCTASCTYEGENTVMLLQTARYLMKVCQQAAEGKPLPATVAYLQKTLNGNDNGVRSWQNTPSHLITAYQQVAAGKIKVAAESMMNRAKKGYSLEDAWNMSSVELANCAEAHARAFIVERFFEGVAALNVSSALKKVLRELSELYSVYWLLLKTGDFIMYSDVTASDIPQLQRWQEHLLDMLRPNAVGLVDSFDFHDYSLSSALGAYDGRVYERLFEEASKSPLNKELVNKSFNKYLKPFLKANL